MKNVGYAHLHGHLALGVLPPRCPARVRPVTRLTRLEEELAVPPERAPADDDLLSYLLFALKHEGVDLAILSETFPYLLVESLVAALEASPNGIYLRRLACLYESFVGLLPLEPLVKGRAVPLFDPERYVTGPARRNSRWRVDVNGLGTLQYCAVVRRTPEVEALLREECWPRHVVSWRPYPRACWTAPYQVPEDVLDAIEAEARKALQQDEDPQCPE